MIFLKFGVRMTLNKLNKVIFKTKTRLSRKISFKVWNFSSKIDFKKRFENENNYDNLIYAVNSAIQFPKNRFYDLWSPQRPLDSLRARIKIQFRFRPKISAVLINLSLENRQFWPWGNWLLTDFFGLWLRSTLDFVKLKVVWVNHYRPRDHKTGLDPFKRVLKLNLPALKIKFSPFLRNI